MELAATITAFNEVPEADVVDPVYQFGTNSSGQVEFTGTQTAEYGVFQYSAPGATSVTYAGSASIGGNICGTLTTATLSGLQPGTTYTYSPDQAYGYGICPASIPSDNLEFASMPVTTVDQVFGVDWCWIGSQQELMDYMDGGFGNTQVGGTNYYAYQAVYPSFTGPFLGTPDDGVTGSAYAPIVGPSATFTTASTSAPSNPTITVGGSGGGGGSDGLNCATSYTCQGTQTLQYELTSAPAADVARVRSLHTREIVLGTTTFSILPHRHQTIHIRFNAAGRQFLAKHPKATNVLLVTTEKTRHRKTVTLVRLLPLGLTRPHRVPTPKHRR
ncbi:MAG: hypothetical protein ACLPZR_06220 [Solirubrobacteraceae bacterium]